MLGLGWLTLRQAQEALRTGRLEEAQRLLLHPGVQGMKRASELIGQLLKAFVDRAERHLRHDDAPSAWSDLLRAEQLGITDNAVARLRQALTRLGLAEVRAQLEAGQPARAVEAVAQLRDRAVRQAELDPVEEAAKEWVLAEQFADRGDFAQAMQALDRVSRQTPGTPAALLRFRQKVAERGDVFTGLLVQLHEAARDEHWQQVVQLAEKVLALAPQHAEARRLRSRAWKAIEPPTMVPNAAGRQPEPPAAPLAPSQQFLLWIDGVGGYLVCLGSRVTFGQATADGCADVPLFADVSRLHAAITRDAEGYLLEGLRPVQINGKPAEKGLLLSGDRITLGTSCQIQFRQPAPVSATARLDLVSGHRLRLAVDAVLLMADTLILGPGEQAHVVVPDLREPVILYRQKDGLGVRHAGTFSINGRQCKDRGTLEPGAVVTGEDFSLTLEPVSRNLGRA